MLRTRKRKTALPLAKVGSRCLKFSRYETGLAVGFDQNVNMDSAESASHGECQMTPLLHAWRARPEGSASTPPTPIIGQAPGTEARVPPFEPYLRLQTKANALCGLVVPEELLLPEQCAPGLVTLRGIHGRERTLPVDDVELHCQGPSSSSSSGSSSSSTLEKLKEILRVEAEHSNLILNAKRVQSRHGGFCGAAFLHDQVPANRWGITMASLNRFVEAVREKWLRSELGNSGGYCPSKFDDAVMGPNMYQVCEQVIRPMTADPLLIMPGVSWALKESLAGTVVTHFVSHAWAEGIFEFYFMLEQKWKQRDFDSDAAAYICFLSNPQNLDIGSMLASIPTSPFYVALQHMPTDGKLIMIATKNAVIHMRLWCVFEAYTAMERGIPVILAGDGLNLATDRNAVPDWIPGLFGLTCCFVLFWIARMNEFQGTFSYAFTLTACSFEKMWWNPPHGPQNAKTEPDQYEVCVLIFPLVPFFFLATVCVLSRAHVCCFGRTRSFLNVRDAQCSSPEDAERIRAVITGKENKINALVGNLIVWGDRGILDN
eukprot:s644_g27.t1